MDSIPGFNIPRRAIGVLAIISQHMAAHGSVIAFRHSVHLPRLLHPDLDPVDDLKAAQTGQESNTFHESRYAGRLVGRSGCMERGKVVQTGFILIRFKYCLKLMEVIFLNVREKKL